MQNDPEVAAHSSGTTQRETFNSGFDAFLSLHSGSSRPSYAGAGTVWLDTSSNPLWVFKMYDGTSDISLCRVNVTTHVLSLLYSLLAQGKIFIGDASGNPAAVTMSGDASLSTAGVLTIAASAISLAKMANLAANSFIGNNTGSPVTPIALTTTQATAMLEAFTADNGVTAGLKGMVPAPSIGDAAAGKLLGVSGWEDPPEVDAFVGFLAHRNGSNQGSISGSTYTKIQFNTEAFDEGNHYDHVTNFRFTPAAGKYLLNCNVALINGYNSVLTYACIYKNGALWARGSAQSMASRASAASVTKTDSANGTDYYEGYVYVGGSTYDVSGQQYDSWFSGHKIG